MGPHCWGWGSGSFFGHPFGMVPGTLFWGIVIYALFVLVSNRTRRPAATRPNETPLDILKQRYARSEIDAEEFVRKKNDLEG